MPWPLVGKAMGLGAVQFGLMYALYIASYQYLPGWAVALLTVFTPLYVSWIGDAMDRRWVPRRSLAAVLAVAGAAVVAARWGEGELWLGWRGDWMVWTPSLPAALSLARMGDGRIEVRRSSSVHQRDSGIPG